jgi:hypothetical protein
MILSKKMVSALGLWSLVVPQAAPQAAQAEILSRNDWGAKPAIETRKPPIEIVSKGEKRVRAENTMPKRETAVFLTIHHTALPVKKIDVKEQLRQMQKLMQDGYTIDYPKYKANIFLGDIPYHFFIDDSGQVAEGRELRFAAYSNTVYLTPIAQHITIVLEGDFETEEPTKEQMASLIDLLESLAKKHKIKLANVTNHKSVVAPGGTTCPGKNLADKMGALKEALAARGIK